jgi:hypothetical protein
MPTPYHIHRAPNALTLACHAPARFDVAAEATLSGAADLLRLAHQVRQDVWRAVQRLRGFSPVVQVTTTDNTIHIRAGGRALPPISGAVSSRIQTVLDDPANRSRWLRHARLK